MTQRLNIDIVARDKSQKALNSLKGRLGKLKASVFNLRNAFIGLGAGLVIRNIVNTGKQIENLKVQLKFLFGSAEEGAKAFDKMAKFASKVPFSLEEIQKGSGVLAVVSDDAEELAHLMEITGNVAAVTGLDFKTTAEQIQRSMSAGISAADLFRDKGVKSMLGFKAGATVSIEETVKAFDRVFSKSGKFGNATKELAKTFEGTLSMIGDKVFNFKKVLLEAGFFAELKNQFGDLNKFLEDNAKEIERIAKAVGKNLAQGMVKVVNIGKDLIPTIQNIGKVLKSIVDGFMTLPPFIQSVGLVGAFIFGKKGAAGLAGISFLIDKVSDFMDDTKVKVGIFDLNNIQDVEKRLKAITEIQGEIFRVMSEGVDVNEKINIQGSELVGYNQENLDLLEKEKKQLESQLYWMKNKSVHALDIFKTIDATVQKQKKGTKDLKKQEKIYWNIFESNNRLVAAQKESVEQIKSLGEALDGLLEKELEKMRTIWERINEIIAKSIVSGIKKTSDALARSVILGENLAESFKRMAQDIAIKLLSALIQWGIELVVAWAVTKYIKKEEQAITREKKKQLALQIAIAALGGGGGGIPFFQHGGAIRKGQPAIVGERGPEMFIPNTSGQITQSARGTGGVSTNVNFSITTLDASGFADLLNENRGTISNIINQAVNERGTSNII